MRTLLFTLSAVIVLLAGCVPPVVEPATPLPPTLPAVATPAPAPSSPLPRPTPTVAPEAPPAQVKPPAPAGPSAIADAAVQYAALELSVAPASIEVISVEAVEWRDSCLGVDKPGEMCLQVITPGYRVLLDVDGKQVAVHTNRDGTVMRLADPAQGAPGVSPSSRLPASPLLDS